MTDQIELSKDDMIYLWVNRNRGLCSRIAAAHNVSGSFVNRILYGRPDAKSAGMRIERALAEAGAPFMKERIGEVA